MVDMVLKLVISVINRLGLCDDIVRIISQELIFLLIFWHKRVYMGCLDFIFSSEKKKKKKKGTCPIHSSTK